MGYATLPSSPVRSQSHFCDAPALWPQLPRVPFCLPVSASPGPARCAAVPSPAAQPAPCSAGQCAGGHVRSENSGRPLTAARLKKIQGIRQGCEKRPPKAPHVFFVKWEHVLMRFLSTSSPSLVLMPSQCSFLNQTKRKQERNDLHFFAIICTYDLYSCNDN